MFGSILVFLVVLSILVLVHEAGHFLTAKKMGVKVEEFGFGIPPRIFGKKIGETLFSVNLLPFGGFVRLHGEQMEEEATDIKRSFLHKSKKARALIVIAGVVMNFILAVICFAVVYSFSGIPKDTGRLKVIDVASSSPAERYGILVGDIITKVGKNEINSADNFMNVISINKGVKTNFEIERNINGEKTNLKLNITPREDPPKGEGPIGVTVTTMELYFPSILLRPFYGIYYGFKDSIFWGKTIAVGLWKMIFDAFHGQNPKDISGPIGIFAVTTESAKNAIVTLINFIGILSVNLAILNILPFPALDGGRLFFIVIEKLIGRKISLKLEATINNIGFIILLGLLLLITIGDIKRLITFGGIQGFLNSMGK